MRLLVDVSDDSWPHQPRIALIRRCTAKKAMLMQLWKLYKFLIVLEQLGPLVTELESKTLQTSRLMETHQSIGQGDSRKPYCSLERHT